MSAEQEIFETLRTLWEVDPAHPAADILPRDSESLIDFYPRFRALVSAAPRSVEGRIDAQAIVQ